MLSKAPISGALRLPSIRQWRLALSRGPLQSSRAAFSSTFRQLVGDTPMRYVTRWRMQVAIDLLTSSDDAMASIAEAVGYESEVAFRNAFRKVIGEPPGQLRRTAAGWSASALSDLPVQPQRRYGDRAP